MSKPTQVEHTIHSWSISIKANIKIGICQLCGVEKELIKAHIIPKQLYKPIRDGYRGGPPRLYKVASNQKPEEWQNGIYDDSILCKECDGKIGVWDGYGQKLFLTSPSHESYSFDGGHKTYKIETFDYKKLKLFFISILWRAAITNSESFAQVKLGSWENKLRTMIVEEDPGSKNDFSILIYKYEGEFSELMPSPTKHRGETEQVDYSVNFYILSFPNYRFIIKVDQRNFSSRLDDLILSPNQPLLIPVMDYKSSVEYEKLQADWVLRGKRGKPRRLN